MMQPRNRQKWLSALFITVITGVSVILIYHYYEVNSEKRQAEQEKMRVEQETRRRIELESQRALEERARLETQAALQMSQIAQYIESLVVRKPAIGGDLVEVLGRQPRMKEVEKAIGRPNFKTDAKQDEWDYKNIDWYYVVPDPGKEAIIGGLARPA